jgi:hypothetical protein
MSAECQKHGCDIVYPEGTWPVGMCQVCELEAKLLAALDERDALVKRAELAEQLEASCRAQMFQFKGERDALRDQNRRYYKLIEDIFVEELNGVLCTPPYKTTEDKDGMGGFTYSDYDAAVSRMYCRSCRSIWQRIRDAVQAHDAASEPQGSRPKMRSPMRPFPGESE